MQSQHLFELGRNSYECPMVEADCLEKNQVTVNCPGDVMLINPPYAHIHLSS